MKTKHPRRDTYQAVTDRIVNALESGTAPWIKPWSSTTIPAPEGTHGHPWSFHSRKPYHGINTVLLWAAQHAEGYAADCWLTYKQAQAKGAHVRKGEHGTGIVFWKWLEVADPDKDGKTKQIPMARMYTVFNVEQVDGLELPKRQPLPVAVSVDPRAEQFIADTGAEIRHGGNRAYCSRATGHIQMPTRTQFADAGAYYATILHELTHWSGHEGRLGRTFGKRFGDQAYAAEELVAEMGSAFLCADFSIQGRLQHESYIQNWIQLLKKDNRAIFTAATKATEAANYLHSIQDQARQAA